MRGSLDRLRRQCDVVKARLAAAETEREIAGVRGELLAFRRRYLAVERMLDFYGDAINTRTNPVLATYLSACDWLAREDVVRDHVGRLRLRVVVRGVHRVVHRRSALRAGARGHDRIWSASRTSRA